MTEHSVKNIASMFNQPNEKTGMARPSVAAKPSIGTRPSVLAKPGKLDLNNSIKIIAPNLRSPHFEKPNNGTVKSPGGKDSPKTGAKTAAMPAKNAAATPVKFPMGGPVMPGANSKEILNMRNMLKKAPAPAPSPIMSPSEPKVDFKRSLKKPPVAPPIRTTPSIKEKSALPSQGSDEMDTSSKENISTSKSEGDCSSLSSFTSDSSIPRRGSATSQKMTGINQKPVLEILPPLETIGAPPQKPAKPANVKLPKSAAMPLSANPEPMDSEADSGEIYDDVAVETNKRFSLIPTMDSDEETGDDIYDDTEVVPLTSLPPLPPVPQLPTITSTIVPDDGPQDVYDDVSIEEGEFEELYEALDVSTEDVQHKRPSVASCDSGDIASKTSPSTSSALLSPRKTMSSKKQEEKQRKEQERLEQQRRKKEDEMRKKREKEERKRREKEEKEMKKKFNIKGDIQVLDTGTVTQDCGSDYEKMDLICKRGDRMQILRREGNPPGKWLARDLRGGYGFVDADFVAIETDCQETYDDVIPFDDSGSEEEEEQQEIYEAFD